MSKLNLIKKVLLADDKEVKAIEEVLELSEVKPLEKEETVQLMEEASLNDGATMVVADPSFEAGASIMVKAEDGTEIPMPVTAEGEAYELEDGRQFTVSEEGVIAEVMEAGNNEEEPVQEEEEVAMDNTPSNEVSEQPVPKVITESVVKEMKFSSQEEAESKVAELEAKLAELSSEEEEVKEEVELSVKPITHNPEEAPVQKDMKFQWGTGREMSAADRVMQKLANK